MANETLVLEFPKVEPEGVIYAVRCILEQGRPMLIVRSRSAEVINSPKAKAVANTAKQQLAAYANNGIEPWGGAYVVDATTGVFLPNPPHVKEGEDASKLNIRYERKFRLNPTLGM